MPKRQPCNDLRATLALAILLLALAAPAGAQVAGIPGFTPIGDYLIEIDGVDEKSAAIYGHQRARSLVVMSAELPAPVLIDLANGGVAALQLMKVAERSDGSLDVLPNPVAQSYGNYRIDGARILFDVEGRTVAVKPKPVLMGNQGPEALIEHDPTYRTKRDIYTAAPALIEELRQQSGDLRVRVYFGTWCPFCAEMVPRVLKIAQELEGSSIRFEYYGLPRSISEDAEARAMDISGVPTGVVYRAGREIGRIRGNSWRSPEQALLDIIESG